MNLTIIEQKKSNWLQQIVLILSIGVFLFSLFKIGHIVYGYVKNDKIMAEIQEVYHKDTSTTSKAADPLESMTEINEDIIGWLTIDDTKIDYPILQSTDNEYYLNRNYKKEESKAGSIFMDYRNKQGADNLHTIIYGHEMKNGSMFGELEKFLDEDFFSKHHTFQYKTKAGNYEVEIFSVYATTTEFDYLKTEFSTDEQYKDFLQTISVKSAFPTNVELNEQDQIITLSTCSNLSDPNEGRFVVHGKITEIQ